MTKILKAGDKVVRSSEFNNTEWVKYCDLTGMNLNATFTVNEVEYFNDGFDLIVLEEFPEMPGWNLKHFEKVM